MTDEELYDALDGLIAYDMGSIDSGIHDNDLKARCKQELKSRPKQARLQFISRLVRDKYLTEEDLEAGGGIEDVMEFLRWLADEMQIDLT